VSVSQVIVLEKTPVTIVKATTLEQQLQTCDHLFLLLALFAFVVVQEVVAVESRRPVTMRLETRHCNDSSNNASRSFLAKECGYNVLLGVAA
jgi:hypothetical protein